VDLADVTLATFEPLAGDDFAIETDGGPVRLDLLLAAAEAIGE